MGSASAPACLAGLLVLWLRARVMRCGLWRPPPPSLLKGNRYVIFPSPFCPASLPIFPPASFSLSCREGYLERNELEVNPGKLLAPMLSPLLVAQASSWLIPSPSCLWGSSDEHKKADVLKISLWVKGKCSQD